MPQAQNQSLHFCFQTPHYQYLCTAHYLGFALPTPTPLYSRLYSAFYSYNCCIIFFEDIFQPALLLMLKLNFRNAETEFQNNWSKGYKSRSTFIWANGAPMDFVTNQLIAMRAKLWFTIRGKQREAQLLHALFGKGLLMIRPQDRCTHSPTCQQHSVQVQLDNGTPVPGVVLKDMQVQASHVHVNIWARKEADKQGFLLSWSLWRWQRERHKADICQVPGCTSSTLIRAALASKHVSFSFLSNSTQPWACCCIRA